MTANRIEAMRQVATNLLFEGQTSRADAVLELIHEVERLSHGDWVERAVAEWFADKTLIEGQTYEDKLTSIIRRHALGPLDPDYEEDPNAAIRSLQRKRGW